MPAVSGDDAYGSVRRSALEGGTAMLVRYAVVGLVSIVGTAALVRAVGAADWAIASVGYFLVVFLDYAFGATLLGALVRGREEPSPRRLQAAAALMWCTAAGTVLAGLALAVPAAELYGRDELGWCLVAVGSCGAVYALRAPALALLERHLRYRTIAVAEVIDQFTFYSVAIPAAVGGFGLAGILLALAVRGIPSALLLRRRAAIPLAGRFDREETGALLRFGVPNAGAALLVLVHGLVPLVVLGSARGAELGYVLAANTVLGYAAVIQLIGQRIGFASLARLEREPAALAQAVRRGVAVASVATVAAALPVTALAPLWLPALFGQDWETATFVFAYVAAAVLVHTVTVIGLAAFNASGKPQRVFAVNLVGTVAYVALAVPLAGLSALLGVPLALAASRFAGALLTVALSQPPTRGPLARWLAVLLAAAATSAGLAALCEHRPALAVIATTGALAAWLIGNRRLLALIRDVLRSGLERGAATGTSSAARTGVAPP